MTAEVAFGQSRAAAIRQPQFRGVGAPVSERAATGPVLEAITVASSSEPPKRPTRYRMPTISTETAKASPTVRPIWTIEQNPPRPCAPSSG